MQGAVLRKEREAANVSQQYGVTELMTPREAAEIAAGEMPPSGGRLSQDFMMRLRADVNRHSASAEVVADYITAFSPTGGDLFGKLEFRQKYLPVIQEKILDGKPLPGVLLKGKRSSQLMLVGAILATISSSDPAYAVFAELWQLRVKM